MKLGKVIGNIFLASLLLVATTGVTLCKHYCMGRLKSVAVFEQSMTCHGNEKDAPPCCEDIHTELKVEEVTQPSFEFNSQPDLFQIATISWTLKLYEIEPNFPKPLFSYYPPPPPETDRQSYFQVYLI